MIERSLMSDPPQIDSNAFRAAFEQFLGPEKYKRFVRALHVLSPERKRLNFWQDGIWQVFLGEQPQFTCGLAELRELLNICELHHCEFRQKTVPVFHGCADYAQEYWNERAVQFPHASAEMVSTEGRPFTGNSVEIEYCPACDEVRETTRWRTKPKK
jgi:hypothetical protein